MKKYEIRFVGAQFRRDLSCMLASDYAAVRRAMALARYREAIEVWCADACIYAQPLSKVGHGNF